MLHHVVAGAVPTREVQGRPAVEAQWVTEGTAALLRAVEKLTTVAEAAAKTGEVIHLPSVAAEVPRLSNTVIPVRIRLPEAVATEVFREHLPHALTIRMYAPEVAALTSVEVKANEAVALKDLPAVAQRTPAAAEVAARISVAGITPIASA